MRTYPALDISFTNGATGEIVDLVLAEIDDAAPTAVEPRPNGVRVFFDDPSSRDAALALVTARFADATVAPLLVPDEDWAERSQASLRPVRVGRLVIAPPWAGDEARSMADRIDDAVVVMIQPSMGFGTGHHESTRLCLQLLQEHVRAGARVLDIGTGSGVLAIAARRIGAAAVVAVDVDRDALASAAENVDLNGVDDVTLEVGDIARGAAPLLERHAAPGGFDLVFANITGAMLERHAAAIAATLAPGGLLITSGYQTADAADVATAFGEHGLHAMDEAAEGGWVATALKLRLPDLPDLPNLEPED